MAQTEKRACRAMVPSIRKKAPDSRRRSLRRRGGRNTVEAACRGSGRPRSSQHLAYRGYRLVLAQHLEPLVEKQGQRTMVVICGELARAGLERERVAQLYSASGERRERRGEKCARDALPAPLRCDREANDDCRLEHFARQRRGFDAHAVEAVRQRIPWLCVQPPDHVRTVKSETPVHGADLDARLHGGAILRRRQRRPVDGLRDVIEVTVALGPLRIVGERRAALVIEEAQKICTERGRKRLDGGIVHIRSPPEARFSIMITSTITSGPAGSAHSTAWVADQSSRNSAPCLDLGPHSVAHSPLRGGQVLQLLEL